MKRESTGGLANTAQDSSMSAETHNDESCRWQGRLFVICFPFSDRLL